MLVVKNLPANAGDTGDMHLIPGSGRSSGGQPGLSWWLRQYRICLQWRKPEFHSLGLEDPLVKGTATHSSILAWEIPWTEESGGLCPQAHRELDMTEWLTLLLSHFEFSSVTQSCPTLCDPMDCSMPGLPVHSNSRNLLMSTASVMPSSNLILHCPLLLPPLIFTSIRVFPSESVLRIRWPKYCSFSISPSNEYSGLICFSMDWLDLLAVQGTLSTVFSNTTVQKHQFFSIQLSLWSNSHIHTWLLEKP